MRTFLIKLFINASALWIVERLFDGIWISDSTTLMLSAFLFGLLNTFIKPVLIILTLPINILSLGLFTIIINAIILQITDTFIDGFNISDFGTAVFASVFISVISILLNHILKDNNRRIK